MKVFIVIDADNVISGPFLNVKRAADFADDLRHPVTIVEVDNDDRRPIMDVIRDVLTVTLEKLGGRL